jgi:selenocysteine lyase/cysteine desulfurase
VHPTDVAAALASERVAVWSGDSYAVEAARALGLSASGVGVRAGVVRYVTDEDVQQLLRAVDRIA